MFLRGFYILLFSFFWVQSFAHRRIVDSKTGIFETTIRNTHVERSKAAHTTIGSTESVIIYDLQGLNELKNGTPKKDALKNDTLKKDTLESAKVYKKRDLIPNSTTVSAQQLSGKQLENSNSLNVADALKGFSGVQIRDYGGIGGMKTIDVRSLGSKHTAIFYDGMPINDAQSGEIDLSKFSLDNLQSISLYNNNHHDIEQPAKAFASASAIYLQTKSPIFVDNKKTNLRTSIKGGSFGLINPSLSLQQKVSGNTSLSFNSEWMKAKGEYDFHYKNQALLDTVIRRKNTDIETFRIEAIAHGLLADSSLWRINSYVYFSERGLPGPAVNNSYYVQDRQDDKNLFLQAFWNKQFSDFYQLKVSAKYSYNWMRYLDPNYLNSAGRLENFYTQKEVYLSAVNIFRLTGLWKASISTDYFNNQLASNMVHFSYPKRNTGLVNLAMEYQNPRWKVQGNLLSTFVQESVTSGTAIDPKTVFSPSVSFSFNPFIENAFYLRGSYKSIFRLPTFNDSYYTFIGSTDLKPEYVKEINIGFTFQKEFDGLIQNLSLRTDVYHNDIKDRITALPRSFRWTMMNIGKVKIEGIEIGLQGHLTFTEEFQAYLSINTTFQKGIDVTPDGYNYGQDIPYSPRNSSSASVNFNYRNWGLSTNSLYSGAKYSGRDNRISNYLDDWFTQDLSLSYEFKLPLVQLKLVGEINNLFNADYVMMENYPMPGTNYRASIHINY